MMRDLKRDPDPQSIIANTVGGACYDGRISAAIEHNEAQGDFVGPFRTEQEFIELLRSPHISEVVHQVGHRIVFTHGDINLRNVLVDESGRLSALWTGRPPGGTQTIGNRRKHTMLRNLSGGGSRLS